MEMEFYNPDKGRQSVGPTFEEVRNEVKGRAKKLADAYEKNVAGLLENRGVQHGAKDPEGHMHSAQQMLRVLNTVAGPQVTDPYHWPEHFDRSHLAHIPLVFIDSDGTPVVKEISARDFDNPKKFVDSAEEILMAGQIEGL